VVAEEGEGQVNADLTRAKNLGSATVPHEVTSFGRLRSASHAFFGKM